MELQPRAYKKIQQLVGKGVDIPNPLTLDIGDDVDIERISSRGVRIYPGCRIYGGQTVISEGAQLGSEGPVTVQNCFIGPEVSLKGGFFNKAVFLEKAHMGLGAHVREGSILEEEANGAHCVGLKQTILFPFVTLGSLINFCDCLMAGGTSRKDHSEVGSSYIHFNFTPDGNKTTASLMGDVPRGVMLNQPPIFLGGQGGMVGPTRIGFGCVSVAGTILRKDTLDDGKLIVGKTYPEAVMDVSPNAYAGLVRLVKNNVIYLANLAALDLWYRFVRQPFFSRQELGDLMYAGALGNLQAARNERTKRLLALAEKVPVRGEEGSRSRTEQRRYEVHSAMGRVCTLFDQPDETVAREKRDGFLADFEGCRGENRYVAAVQSMPPAVSAAGTAWLQDVVDEYCKRAAALLPSLNLFQ